VKELMPNMQTDQFFSRLTNPHLGVQTAMILLRHCGVPKMSYLLRVTPPAAIKDVATQFDYETLRITHELLGLTGTEQAWNVEVIQQLQAPLRYGGFGITSATATSHSAYIASVVNALLIQHLTCSLIMSTDPVPMSLNCNLLLTSKQPNIYLMRLLIEQNWQKTHIQSLD
jgi:hypothetical protein